METSQFPKRRVRQRFAHAAPSISRRRFVAGVLALPFATASRAAATGGGNPVRFIVPLGPGSGADSLTRYIARRYAEITGQPTIVENKPGADTVIGVMSAVSAPADGRTILYVSPSPLAILPLTQDKLPYDPQRDLRLVTLATRGTSVIVVRTDSRFHSLADIISAARAQPGTVSFANYGLVFYFGAVTLERMSKVKFNHVTYKGASQANTDLISGVVDVHATDVGGVLPLITAGRLRAIAVTGDKRHAYLPNVPTVAESGYPGYNEGAWGGFAVHGQTSNADTAQIEDLLLGIAREPGFATFAAQQAGLAVVGANGAEFQKFVQSETDRYRVLLNELKPR